MPPQSFQSKPTTSWSRLLPYLGGLLLSPSLASAATVAFKVEPDVAIPLSEPQSDLFGVGGGESMKLLVGLTPWLDIGPTASVHLLPALDEGTESAMVWAFGGGLRIKRPHDAEGAGGISPWLDADLFYVRTGELDRPGFDAAVGLGIPVNERRTLWVGPFVRYQQVVQTPHRDGFDNRDLRMLSLGISLEVGTGIEEEETPVPQPTVCPESAPCPPPAAPACPDRDKDGMPDQVDRCPDVPGLVQDFGCPVYNKIIVHHDRIELREKIFFAHNLSKIEEVSYPILDDVVLAMKNDSTIDVSVQGHTDATGSEAYNLELSDRRSAAVVSYLVAHGVAADRLSSKGFGESQPLESNSSVDGREKNRRVDFLVQPATPTDGSAQ